PANDRSRWNTRVNADWNPQAAIDRERIIVELHNPRCGELISAGTSVGRCIVAKQRTGSTAEDLVGNVLQLLRIDVQNGWGDLIQVPHRLEHGVDLADRAPS